MSKPGIIYRLSWNTVPSVLRAGVTVPAQAMVVNIYDTLTLIDDADDPAIIQLQADATPLIIKVINNDEDKFSPIRAKQAIIQFKSDINQFQDSTTFADSPDNRWKVECTADGTTVFLGFLMLTDIQQDHLPDPNTVVLTASDHLALLKDIPWTTDALVNPTGKIRIAECIALALKKTGLRLDIVVVNNLRHGSGQITLDATFTAADDRIAVSPGTSSFFYEGQVLNVTGTTSNNIPMIVTDVTETDFGTLSTVLTNEGPVSATFTDYNSTAHFYSFIFLDAKTFEQEIGISEDCNTVLTKILGEDCFLTQWLGKWYIMRIDEYDGNPIYPATFDPDGGYSVVYEPATNFNKSIGASETRRLANADALRRYDRPHRYVKETAKYRFPVEIICNIDFSRGDVIVAPDLASGDSTATYQLDCWTLRRITGAITSTAHITRKFVFGTEKERYVTITPKTGGTATPWDFIESSAVELGKNDRANVAVDWKYDTDFAGGGTPIYPMRIYLLADDGTYYYWWHPTSNDPAEFYWVSSVAEAERLIPVTVIPDDVDMSLWQNFSVELGPLPASGKLYIGLNQGQQVSTGGSNQNINYQSLQFTYKPYINGSYQLFTGHYDQVLRLNSGSFGYNAKRDEEVFIFDSPRKEFKGAMFFYNGLTYVLTTKWYAGNVFALGYPDDQTYMHPYGHIQSYAVWNQYRNANRIFSTSVLGLGSMWVDALDKISLTDNNPNTNNRYFLLISFEQNWKTALWSGVFVEDYRTDIGHNYDDTHSFAYTSK